MKKLFILLCFFSFITNINCQSWVAPGATWSYRLKTQTPPCYDITYEVKNTGTVTSNGKVCDKLSVHRYGWQGFQCSIAIPVFPADIYTRKSNGVIYARYTIEDTIVDFNAVPGSGWYHSSGWDSSNCKQVNMKRRKTVVQDTGHVVISGFSLKSLTVMTTPGTYTWQIVERIGNLSGYFYQSYCCYMDCYGNGSFSCYWDNNFALYSVNSDCNYNPVATNESTLQKKEINVYPNPSSGIYNIDVLSGSQIEVFDPLGRVVITTSFKDSGKNEIDLSLYPTGAYYLKLRSEDEIHYCNLIRSE